MKTIISFTIAFLGFIFMANSQNSWTRKSCFPTYRDRAVAFSIGKYGYVGTGSDMDSFKSDFWRYDPDRDLWQTVSSMPTAGRLGAFCFVINSKGYVGGGIIGLAGRDWQFWEYNPDNDTWTRKRDLPLYNYSEEILTGFAIADKGYLVASGSKNLWEYDPDQDTWSDKARYPGVLTLNPVGFVIEKKGYFGTGFTSYGSSSDFWEYDPNLDKWTAKRNFPGFPRSAAIAFSIGHLGYLGLGRSDYLLLKDFWEYDPVLDQWKRIADCGYAAYDAVAMAINSKGYVGTGIVRSGTCDFWEYSPIISSIESENSARNRFSPNPFNDRLYFHSHNQSPLPFFVFSVDGQLIKSGIAVDGQIPVAELKTGLYFIRVFQEKEVFCQKVFKE